MHTDSVLSRPRRRRAPVVAVLATGLLGLLMARPSADAPGLRALLIKSGDDAVREQFTVTLDRAAQTERRRAAVVTRRRGGEAEVRESARHVAELMARKRAVRLAIAAAERDGAALRAAAGIPEHATGATVAVAPFLTALSDAREPALLRGPVAAFAAAIRGESATASLQEDFERVTARDIVARRAHLALIARVAGDRALALRAEHDDLLARAGTAARDHDQASAVLARARGDAAVIQAVMRDVHDQVLRLQANLQRIDARLRERAERELLAKGLIDPSAAATRRVTASAPDLRWPARGRISAGYLDGGYAEHFGVPHHGIDIAVNEGTPVASAADGIVFLVRDGGETGYTYVLIGHRGGMATLYGHLRSVAVASGQEVTAGQIIGSSGGRPGTPGAGPLTTAPHLHFEAFLQGANVNPLEVLPGA